MKSGLMAVMVPLVFLAATTAQAQDNAPDKTAPKAEVKEKRICRSDEDTGSIVPHRTCHTKSEWQVIDKQLANTTTDGTAPRASVQ